MREKRNIHAGRGFLVMLITWVIAIFLGWLIFSVALGSYYYSNTVHYEGLVKDSPNMVIMFLAILAQVALIVFVLHWLDETVTFGRGFVVGGLILLLYNTNVDLYIYSNLNLMNGGVVLVDILVNAIYGGVLGGIAGWMLGFRRAPKDQRTIS